MRWERTFLVSQLTTWPLVSLTLTRLEPAPAVSPPPPVAGEEGGCSESIFAFLWMNQEMDCFLSHLANLLLSIDYRMKRGCISPPERLLDGGDSRGHGARHAARLALLQRLQVRHQLVQLILEDSLNGRMI